MVERCARCNVNEDEVRLFDAIYEGRMSSLCERCSIIENIPIRRINFNDAAEKSIYNDIVDATKQLIEITTSFMKATTPNKQKLYERQIISLKNNLFGEINKLYKFTFEDLKNIETLSEQDA